MKTDIEMPEGMAQAIDEIASEALTTASERHPCELCGRPLKGRQERFCSDRCRTRTKRQEAAGRIDRMLNTLEQTAVELRRELIRERQVGDE